MYKALYRKWRPLTFDDVISQQHITDTLKNQIVNGKTAHAYLFTGSRGTGKTTCARILAKAVNCLHMKDGNPCLECELCRDADSGALTDIVEIDAASNNGVDNIRELRDGTVFTPERCTYKVYIIDEVHMLSAGAFNALLKIMEEPPPYVKFILATTEIHKVPATIASRCQRYDFRRIRADDIAARLKYIASQEDIDLTDDGAALIAKLADGGMRDAVSLLDQCSVCAETVNAETVSAAAGIAGRDYLYNMLDAVCDADVAGALSVTGELYDMSKDLTRLCEELIGQLRNIMLLKVSPQTADKLIVCMPDELEKLKALAEKSPLETVMHRLEVLQQCRERMARVINKRVEFEMTLIRLCSETHDNVTPQTADTAELYDKLKKLESKLENVSSLPSAPPEKREVMEADAPATEERLVPTVDIRKLKPEDLINCERWGEVLKEFEKVNPAVAGSLDGSTAATAGNIMFITAVNRFFMELFRVKENAVSLGEVIDRVLGQRFIIKARCATTVTEQKNLAESAIKKANDSGIETAVDNNQDPF